MAVPDLSNSKIVAHIALSSKYYETQQGPLKTFKHDGAASTQHSYRIPSPKTALLLIFALIFIYFFPINILALSNSSHGVTSVTPLCRVETSGWPRDRDIK